MKNCLYPFCIPCPKNSTYLSRCVSVRLDCCCFPDITASPTSASLPCLRPVAPTLSIRNLLSTYTPPTLCPCCPRSSVPPKYGNEESHDAMLSKINTNYSRRQWVKTKLIRAIKSMRWILLAATAANLNSTASSLPWLERYPKGLTPPGRREPGQFSEIPARWELPLCSTSSRMDCTSPSAV